MIKATVVKDSISPKGKRLTTMLWRYPKFIHGEFMTHRVMSRNASSSRAIPTKKYIEEVTRDDLRAEPEFWGLDQPGMQSFVEMDEETKAKARDIWRRAAIAAAGFAEEMDALNGHKQVVNRLMEPFIHINVVVTATEWDNFFGLRLDAMADPTMKALAVAAWRAMYDSKPTLLQPGEWHLPFVEDYHSLEMGIKISVARCARTSYLSFDTGRYSLPSEDFALYSKLLGAQPIHASPAEHQATPDEWDIPRGYYNPQLHGNLVGWKQYRKTLPGENCAPLPQEYINA